MFQLVKGLIIFSVNLAIDMVTGETVVVYASLWIWVNVANI